MKKILSIILALAMVLSMTAVSLGEAAEAYEPAEYADFEAHLNAFMSKLNAIDQDIYLAANGQGTTIQLLLGTNEDGVVNAMLGVNDQAMATFQADQEAAYVDYQGTKMAIRLDTVQSFISNLPAKLNDYAKAMGIDVNQVMADVQQLVPVLQMFVSRLAPAVAMTQEGSVITVTVNGEALGEAMIPAVEDLLNDGTVNEIYAHYAPMFKGPDLADVAAAWKANEDSVKAVIATLEAQFTMDNENNTFVMTGKAGSEEMGFVVNLDYNGKIENGKDVSMTGTMSMKANGQEMKVDINESFKFGSFWLEYPTEMDVHEVIWQNGETFGSVDVSYRLNEMGMPMEFKYVVDAQGMAIDMEYADSVFFVKMNGEEMLYCAYLDGVVTIRSQGQEVTCKGIESDANHVTYQIDITANGQTQTGYIVCQILESDGQEYLELQAVSNGEVTAYAQLRQTEKQAFPLLKDDAELNWVTEDQLNSMLDSYVSMLLSRLNGGR